MALNYLENIILKTEEQVKRLQILTIKARQGQICCVVLSYQVIFVWKDLDPSLV